MKITVLLLLLPFISCTENEKVSYPQKVLQQDYSFIGADGEIFVLRQSNDTLYGLKCYTDRPCVPNPRDHYKILSATQTSGFTLLKLEKLDTIALTTNPYPATRYQLLAFKNIDEKQLGWLPLKGGLTRQQLDTVQTDIKALKNSFFFTFYSSSYMKELGRLPKITTKEQVQGLIELVQSNTFKPLLESYSKTETHDMYASGLSSELINKACIQKGYNPIGAGLLLDGLMK